MTGEEKKNNELLDKLEQICATEKSDKVIKAQIALALKELTLPEMRYQNKPKLIFFGKGQHTDTLTTLFVVATGQQKNKLAAFLLNHKMADKNAVITSYGSLGIVERKMADTLPHMAIRFDNTDVFSLLEKAGVSTTKKNGEDLTPEQLAYKIVERQAQFLKRNFMQFVHSDTPEHNSDMYLFANNQGVLSNASAYFRQRACMAAINRVVEKSEPTKVATQNVQHISGTARQNGD